MKEQEARTKWCPMVRVGINASNRLSTDKETRCIASDCMMWREYRGKGWCGLAGHDYDNGRRK